MPKIEAHVNHKNVALTIPDLETTVTLFLHGISSLWFEARIFEGFSSAGLEIRVGGCRTSVGGALVAHTQQE